MRALSTAASTGRHVIVAFVEASLMVAILGALALGVGTFTGHPAGAGTVQAANGGGGSGAAWISLNAPTSLAVSGTNTATFSIGQGRTSQPYVRVNCTVNGVLAYSQLLGYFPGWAYGQTFTFSSNYLSWNYSNQPLNCIGNLEWLGSQGGEHVMASTSFTVNP